jgi:hypothetical protein
VAALASCVVGAGRAGAQDEIVTDWKIFNVADTNADNMADLLWVSPSTNRLTVSLMRGTHVLATGPQIPGPPGEGWTAVTAADFNRDGYNDVIWTNERRGTMAVWLLRPGREEARRGRHGRSLRGGPHGAPKARRGEDPP